MSIEELSFVISYLMRQPFFTSMLQTTLQEISGKKAKEDKVALYGAVLDALIFDGDYQGKKPFAYFLKNAPLTPKQKKLYGMWQLRNHFSLFEIVSLKSERHVVIEDIINGNKFTVEILFNKLALLMGDTISARIIPHEKKKNIWSLISGNVTTLPKDVTDLLKKELQKETFTEDISALDFTKYIYSQQ